MLLLLLFLLLLLLLLWTNSHVLLLLLHMTDLKTVSGVSQIWAWGRQVNNPLAFEVDAHLQQVGSSDGSHKNGKFVCPLKLVKPIKKGTKSWEKKIDKITNLPFTGRRVQPVQRVPPLCWIAPGKAPSQVPGLLPHYHPPSPESRNTCHKSAEISMGKQKEIVFKSWLPPPEEKTFWQRCSSLDSHNVWKLAVNI